jgi:hypothetical protein
MRFVLGPPPDADDFHPDESGWRKLREPSSYALIAVGSLIGVPVGIAFAYLWSQVQVQPISIQLNLSLFGSWAPVAVLVMLPLLALAFFLLLIAIHELLHALACPKYGLSRETVIGVWPSRLMPYAGHLGEMPCWRYLVMALAPFLVLSVLPLLIAAFVERTPSTLALLSTVNALCCGGDFVLVAVIASQIPLRAAVRNKGWATYWRNERGMTGDVRA